MSMLTTSHLEKRLREMLAETVTCAVHSFPIRVHSLYYSSTTMLG